MSIVITLVGLCRCELRTSCKRKGPQNVTQPPMKLTVCGLITWVRQFTNDVGTHFSLACNTKTHFHRVCRHATKHLGYIYKWFFQSFLSFFQSVRAVQVHNVLSISRRKNPGIQVPVIMLALKFQRSRNNKGTQPPLSMEFALCPAALCCWKPQP